MKLNKIEKLQLLAIQAYHKLAKYLKYQQELDFELGTWNKEIDGEIIKCKQTIESIIKESEPEQFKKTNKKLINDIKQIFKLYDDMYGMYYEKWKS